MFDDESHTGDHLYDIVDTRNSQIMRSVRHRVNRGVNLFACEKRFDECEHLKALLRDRQHDLDCPLTSAESHHETSFAVKETRDIIPANPKQPGWQRLTSFVLNRNSLEVGKLQNKDCASWEM
jgi:hypothetical protein